MSSLAIKNTTIQANVNNCKVNSALQEITPKTDIPDALETDMTAKKEKGFTSITYIKPDTHQIEQMSEVKEKSQDEKDLECYDSLTKRFPWLSFCMLTEDNNIGNTEPYVTANVREAEASSQNRATCMIHIEKKVIKSMQSDKQYAKSVNEILADAGEVACGFIENCKKDTKRLSTDGVICTIGKVETRLVDEGGKPSLVTSVTFEYISTESRDTRTVQQKWNGDFKAIPEEYLKQMQNRIQRESNKF